MEEIEEVRSCSSLQALPLPLLSLNHVSLMCRSVWESSRFYEDVLGFVLIKRPSSFNFTGAWLYNYGIGIHLIENTSLLHTELEPRPINPKDNHISFQCTDVGLVKRTLEELGMRYETAVVEEEGVKVDQVFFHDPDGYMVEICNCDNIPILPILPVSSSCGSSFLEKPGQAQQQQAKCGGILLMENEMMESLSMDIMNLAF